MRDNRAAFMPGKDLSYEITASIERYQKSN